MKMPRHFFRSPPDRLHASEQAELGRGVPSQQSMDSATIQSRPGWQTSSLGTAPAHLARCPGGVSVDNTSAWDQPDQQGSAMPISIKAEVEMPLTLVIVRRYYAIHCLNYPFGRTHSCHDAILLDCHTWRYLPQCSRKEHSLATWECAHISG
jgi:hypothetical protein